MELFHMFVILRSNMGTDNLFHKNKVKLERKLANRSAKQRILIVCEGKKTEPNYFKAFPVTSAEVKVLGEGFNTKALVSYTKEISEQAELEKLPYDQVWCVFDHDPGVFTKEQFNTAIQMAKSHGFKVAYSNEAFELWYILHFEYLHSGINRDQYIKKLTEHLKKPYKKNSTEMYDILLSKQGVAIKYAKKLMTVHTDSMPADSNPSTTVYELVVALNILIK